MAVTGYGGVDVRASGDRLVFDALLLDGAGSLVTSGTTSLYLYEVQNDATLKSYDFNDNTFKSTALTTETASATHRTGNNGTTNTGYWSYALTTVSGFTAGAMYVALLKNTAAAPPTQARKFQYGGTEGDPWAKAMTELSAPPGVTGSVLDALQWLFLLARNKITQTSTTQTLRNNADNASVATSAVSDDGTTFTRAKWS